MQGGDFGLVGDSYIAPMSLQSVADCINFYLEKAPSDKNPKMPNALLGCPGLNFLVSTSNSPCQVRGCWVLPGGQQALVASGNLMWLVTIAIPASANTPPAFASTIVGTLLTNTGPVVMRDNGVLTNGLGGYCLIVDGTYCYYYLLSGQPYSLTFTGGLNSNTTLTLPGSLPNGLIVTSGGQLGDLTSNSLQPGTQIASVDTIALTITLNQAALATTTGETFQLTIPTFGQITDAGFLGADRILFIEGWLMFNQPNTRTFYTTGPTPYQMLFPGLFFALKDTSTDNLVTLMEQNSEAWLIGERQAEVWFPQGTTNFGFQRLPGVAPQIGCAAKHSIARCGAQLVWLGKNEQGENLVVISSQYSWERISNHAIEHAISQYPVVSDAIGYGYEEEGHLFYMLAFPTADVTWCFDFNSNCWHKRLAWDPVAGVYHRHRSNCYMDFANVRIIGDYQTGALLQMSRQFYTDNGAPLRALRRSPHLWSRENRERIFFSQLQIEFNPGVGLSDVQAQSSIPQGQGTAPQAMLRFSDDGGYTWSNELTASIGKTGEFKNRAMWRLLGKARDRVWEVTFTDPVPRDIIGATLYAEG